MAMNVISNYAATVAQRYLQKSDEAATRSVAKLSAGTRVLSARDDAASMAVATSIRSDIAGLKQAAVNTGQASSMLQIADGAMGTVTDILIRAKTLTVQASSDQLTNNQRGQINVEFQALQDEIDRISKGTRFDGQTLLNGTGAAGQSSIVSASVSSSNASNKGAAYGFALDEADLSGAGNPIRITATVGGTEISLEKAVASLDTVAEIATAINNDALFSRYFTASSELINNATTTARLYVTALSSDPLASFKIAENDGTAITGVAAANIKVGQSATFGLGGTAVNARDSFMFKLGGTESTVNMSDVATWGSQVSNVAAASGTADNTVAATKQRVEYDLSSLLTTANDTLTVTIDGTTKTQKVSATGDAVAMTIDALITASATIGGATLSREGNKLVLTATAAGTGFTVTTVNGQKAGATATEVSGTQTQANYTAAAVGTTADGRLVRKNTTQVQSANTDVALTTQESLKFIAAYINDSTSAPHTLGQSVIASVSTDNQLVLTTKGGTLGSQAAFASGGYASSTGTEAFSATFQIGARNEVSERLTVKIANVSAASLGIDKSAAKIETAAQALAALDKINSALDRMASFRSAIGAQQNRLDFAAQNLSVTIENSEAARSNLLDLDVSAEMSFFTSQQILQQAGVSMLAQANQMPQNLLRLFR